MNKKVFIYTLGCKANQADSDWLKIELQNRGADIVDDPVDSDIAVINTCTVTSNASYQSRQVARRILRKKKGIKLIIFGCDAVIEDDNLKTIEGVESVITERSREKILDEILKYGLDESIPKKQSLKKLRSRPFIRIQDGCDNYCSYCIIPFTRGRPISISPADIIDEINKFVTMGYYEVVLTGIHIGKYGADRKDAGNLNSLLQNILKATSIGRVRLSSIEPDEINNELIDLIANSKGRICPHLHIPLQSGSDAILKKMNRRYSSRYYSEIIKKIKTKLPNCSIGADVICGFPGENDEEFGKTYRLLENLPLTYLHVFTYSERKGTKAAEFPSKVSNNTKKERTNRLRRLSVKKREKYNKANIGKTVTAVFENKKKHGMWKGVSENYISVLSKSVRTNNRHNKIVLKAVKEEYIIGEPL